jgi:peroxiredoxin family protein
MLDRAQPVLFSFLVAFPSGKTKYVHLKYWGIPSFEKEPKSENYEKLEFPSFERKYNRKIMKNRKFPSFEWRIY